MTRITSPGLRPVRLGDMSATATRDADGTVRIRADRALDPYPVRLTDRLEHWADATPDAVLLAEREDAGGGGWRRLSYGAARDRARRIGQGLLCRGLSADRPVAILSGNSVSHGLVMLGAMMAGVPVAPVSTAYSLVSTDFVKLRHVLDLVTPGVIFVEDTGPCARALAATAGDAEIVACRDTAGLGATLLAELEADPGPGLEAARQATGPDTVAKFLFTSGSTGLPKAVINTQRMLCANQQMIRQALAFLADAPPVMVDWLPWNHTAGGNHNFGIALYNGGSLYIDDGKPTPADMPRTIRNLEEVSPTLYFNVPKGFEMLTAQFARNPALRARFFARLKIMQYAGASLSQHVWDRLEHHAAEEVGERIMIITGYGSTETAPFAATTTWPVNRPGEVGLPAAGIEMKLVPNGEKLELRLRGPSVTPGYWRQPEVTAGSFDDEGYYRIGDALKFVDPGDLSKGLLFDGRVSEDFKLSTGTWVNFAALRGALCGALAPFVRDAVLTGLDRDHVGAILFLDQDAVAADFPGLAGSTDAGMARDPELRDRLQTGLDRLARKATGSSTLVARALVATEPPSIDAHEVTDKGSINQRAVRHARPGLVADLHADPAPAHVLVADARAPQAAG